MVRHDQQSDAPAAQGLQDDHRDSDQGTGVDAATWTLVGLASGRDRVTATRSSDPNRAANAPFAILDGETPLGPTPASRSRATP